MIARNARGYRETANHELLERARVADVLRIVGVVASSDARKLVRCPLHDDGTPSFRIFDRGWVCFGCDRRGGLLDLVIALGFAVDRRTAVEWLKERFR